jgi:hypothetical protein
MTLDSSLNPERQLLGPPPSASRAEGGGGADHAVRTAAVFTKDALDALGHTAFPQRAVYGRILSQHVPDFVEDVPEDKAPIYINTNAPFSAVVCGVQVRRALVYIPDSARLTRTTGFWQESFDGDFARELPHQGPSNWHSSSSSFWPCVSSWRCVHGISLTGLA